ncbi:hypothetical protein TSOC_006402 [Tetrabaena socialis]|uniref:Uncharacterized protein n=1 Tax=Tetrabaena socialis TaxID=47790 RepID=A0A2J8A3Q0_9CHLO|nr:hypothetical protein TSOC_006402 [Tetrabaena socialis]|eukprot:PNH07155.1 hypothetical protein TSOC_006402 [Tetrabaena socialis]
MRWICIVQSVVYATPRREQSVISEDLRKAEIIINNRASQQLSPTDFVCAEFFRQITQASAQGFVGDYEVIARYSLQQQQQTASSPASSEAPEPGIAATAVPAQSSDLRPAGDAAARMAASPSVTPAAGAPVDAGATGVAAGVGAVVLVTQRVAAFLQPQDAAYFEAGNQAVALYDYTFTLRRVA